MQCYNFYALLLVVVTWNNNIIIQRLAYINFTIY